MKKLPLHAAGPEPRGGAAGCGATLREDLGAEVGTVPVKNAREGKGTGDQTGRHGGLFVCFFVR